MEQQPALTVAIISQKIKLGNNNILLIPKFAVQGTYNKNNKSFITTDGKKYLNARSKRGLNSDDDLVVDFFCNMDSDVVLNYSEGNTPEEKLNSFYLNNRGSISNIMFDEDLRIINEEVLPIEIFDDDEEPKFVDGQPVFDSKSPKKGASAKGELKLILKKLPELNDKFVTSVLDGKRTIKDIDDVIELLAEIIKEADQFQDSAILFRESYQTGEEGMLLKGETKEERDRRRCEYMAREEHTTPSIITNIPGYFNLRQKHENICKTLKGQDEPARAVLREIHRKIVDPSERNLGILITGHTGCGKTKLMQLLQRELGIPVMIVDTTQITTPGYTGRDIEEILYAFYRKYGNDIENGIIYFDEIDKKGSRKHSDVGGRGVLDVLLAFLDGTTYQACDSSSRPTDIVPINTSRMIKIAGGAFSDLDDYKKPLIGFGSDSSNTTQPSSGEFVKDGEMSSEFMGRFPSRVRFNTLDVPKMEQILRESDESMVLKQIEVFKRLGTMLTPTDRYIEEVAKHAVGTGGGARGLSGFVLETTGPAYEDINMNLGEIAEIVLTDDTVKDPSQYQKVLRK